MTSLDTACNTSDLLQPQSRSVAVAVRRVCVCVRISHKKSSQSVQHNTTHFTSAVEAETMEEALKRELGTKSLKSHGSAGGGCISSGVGYQTDSGPVFVKLNRKKGVSACL